MFRRLAGMSVALLVLIATTTGGAASTPQAAARGQVIIAGGPRIAHIVIIDQENHSFDNVLGLLCLQLSTPTFKRCEGPMTSTDGTPIGFIHDGTSIALPKAKDIVPPSPHSVRAQTTAINGGSTLMSGFDLMVEGDQNCAAPDYSCYQAFDPKQIPNLAALATNYVIADRTFQSDSEASWGSHLGLVAGTLDGFYGDNPCFDGRCPSPPPPPAVPTGIQAGPGWGCDSNRDALWAPTVGGQLSYQPTCVPDPALPLANHGAYRPTSVSWVPTLMDRLDGAGLPWRLYAGGELDKTPSGFENSGYQWAICPTFADCLYTSQARNLALASQVITDATNGDLPAVSIVTPTLENSQHNFSSMKKGDNWIGKVVDAIENGPDWSTTAIFITYDDCGCFYDHVTPPTGLGIRAPMVIVSPWARQKFTDSNVASYASLLAFIEHQFELQPLGGADASAYDFADSFDFSQPRLATVQMVTSPISADEILYLQQHPGPVDDPT